VHALAQRRAVLAIAVSTLFVVWAVGAWMTWFTWHLASDLPGKEDLRRLGDMAQATTLLDVHDKPAFTIYKEQRIEVPLARVSPLLIKAFVSVEDQRFYEHGGVDMVRIAGAVLANLREGRRAQGGSTITQQLARQSVLTTDKTWRRKLQEMILALRIERAYSKAEILELYLNKVYLGDGLYGVEAASLGYFGKHAADLALPEAALLAGLVKSPSSYAPTVSVERAVNRRNVVLQAMADAGAITRAEADSAKDARVALHDVLRRDEPHGQYFKEQVRRALVEQFGWQRVYQGGLRVFTTIDLDMQKEAESQVAAQLEDIEKQRLKALEKRSAGKKGKAGTEPVPPQPPLQAALVALDPATGEVRALVGGRNFEESRFNRAVQARRQPGSAFKPFVYAAAIEAGYTPASLVERLDEPVMTLQGEWSPEDEHSGATEMTLRTALRTSSNRAAVRLLEEVGIDKTVNAAKNLGVGSVPSVPSLALGSGEVTLVSMTAAYASFANKGVLPTPVLIRRVEDVDGKVLFAAKEEGRRVLSETTAFLMTSMLSDVINFGTAWKARRLGFTLPAAGKTGTTNDYVDAWFVGFTPKLVTGVWVGFDQPQTIMPQGYAGDVAVPLWARFMKDATKGEKPAQFPIPKGIVSAQVCRLSGKLPNKGCDAVDVIDDDGNIETRSMIYTEYFVRGTEPTELCPLHEDRSFFDRVAGLFGKDGPAPASVGQLGLPVGHPGGPPAAATAGAQADEPVPTDGKAAEVREGEKQQKKKRGFWSRLFGRGKDDGKNEGKDEQDPKRNERQEQQSPRP
jgi:penicillin-binding protein 1A